MNYFFSVIFASLFQLIKWNVHWTDIDWFKQKFIQDKIKIQRIVMCSSIMNVCWASVTRGIYFAGVARNVLCKRIEHTACGTWTVYNVCWTHIVHDVCWKSVAHWICITMFADINLSHVIIILRGDYKYFMLLFPWSFYCILWEVWVGFNSSHYYKLFNDSKI